MYDKLELDWTQYKAQQLQIKIYSNLNQNKSGQDSQMMRFKPKNFKKNPQITFMHNLIRIWAIKIPK